MLFMPIRPLGNTQDNSEWGLGQLIVAAPECPSAETAFSLTAGSNFFHPMLVVSDGAVSSYVPQGLDSLYYYNGKKYDHLHHS